MAARNTGQAAAVSTRQGLLPTIDLCGKRITRLICGGNPFSGFVCD